AWARPTARFCVSFRTQHRRWWRDLGENRRRGTTTMIAAVYARKSTSQDGIADDQKSVARQVEHATAYAASKGSTVDPHLIFADDGISGAEFDNRPGYQRLMAALKPRPPFQALIMSEESRLGRESTETFPALKRILAAGVRIFSYLEDREVLLGTLADNTM